MFLLVGVTTNRLEILMHYHDSFQKIMFEQRLKYCGDICLAH
jgi:hypothetical protein